MLCDDDRYMAEALALARQAAERGEVPVGAVVVCEGRVVGRGYNQMVSTSDPSAHAEIVALRAAALHARNYRLPGCTLYVTVEPCAMCAQAALHARLARVVYGAPEPRSGAAGSIVNLFSDRRLNAHTVVQGGVLADEAAALLRDFFARRRAEKRAAASPLRPDALRTPDEAFARVWQRAQALGLPRSVSRTCNEGPALAGLRLHWLDVGPADDPLPWLCLHGPQAWWPQWLPWLVAARARGERCLVPDLIGFGQSDKPKRTAWHTLERHAEVLASWLDALGVEACRLVLAPGAQVLLPALRARLGLRLREAVAAAPTALLPPEKEWLEAPFPDRGHRAGPEAFAALSR